MLITHTLFTDYLSKMLIFGYLLFFINSPIVLANSSIALNCPTEYEISVDPCLEGWDLTYDSITWSSDVALVDTLYSPAEGTFLEDGDHPASIVVTDVNGVISICNFIITVNADANPYLVCNYPIEVSLETGCEQTLTSQMVLKDGPYCHDDHTLEISGLVGQLIDEGKEIILDQNYLYTEYIITVTNLEGNICWTILEVTLPTPHDIQCPADLTVFCHEPIQPSITGTPTIISCFDESQSTVSYYDQEDFFTCPDSVDVTISRTWMAVNDYNEIATCQQTITAIRYSFDDILFPQDYDDIQLTALSCNQGDSISMIADTSVTGYPLVNGYFPDLITCDFSVTFNDTIHVICGASTEIKRRWRVIDWCTSDILDHVQTIIIKDDNPAQFEVPDQININMLQGCSNIVSIPSIDLIDECSGFDVKIASPFDTIYSNGGDMLVEFNHGNYDLIYEVTDDCGNVSIDTSNLKVEDGDLLQCPDNQSISTTNYSNQLQNSLEAGDMSVLSILGEPIFYSNCALPVLDTAIINLDSCGNGMITRTITSLDSLHQLSCQQQIQVHHVSDFIVEFPDDLSIDCEPGVPLDFGEPKLKNDDWENIQISFEDTQFDVVPDACYKILREWTVVNLCVTGLEVDQEVIELPEQNIGLPWQDCDFELDGDCDARTFRDSWNGLDFPDEHSIGTDGSPDLDPDADPWDGFIEYNQTIKVRDDVAPEFDADFEIEPFCIIDNTCGAMVSLPMPDVFDCSEVNITVTSDIGSGFGPYQNVAPGTYDITYTAQDNCGNKRKLETEFEVVDCKSPTAFCKNGIIVELSFHSCEVQVWAVDLDDGSFDNCPGSLQFSFSNDISDKHIIYNEWNFGQNNVEIWVTDQSGNQSHCNSFIIVEDFFDCTMDLPNLFGEIKTENDKEIKDVQVTFLNSTGWVDQTNTNSNGKYNLHVFQYDSILILPEKDFNPLNGVTTFDLVLIQRHILFIKMIDSPYKLIAADANNSGSVTISDAVALKKLILFIDLDFPNNTSWRFVKKDYEFPNPNNPWQEVFPEFYNDFPNDFPLIVDFIGIKIGDINGNVDPQNLGKSDDRNFVGSLNFELPNINYEASEIIEVPFKINRTDIEGYQFTLDFNEDNLALASFNPGFSTNKDFGTSFLDEGILTSSWVGNISHSDSIAFTLIFKALDKGNLQNNIRFNDDFVKKEAYTTQLDYLDINFDYKIHNGSNRLKLLPNQPNPFSEKTSLKFVLPQKEEISLKVFSLRGELVFEQQKSFDAGVQEFEIRKENLPQAGIYYYQISTPQQTETQKIILIK